MAHLATTSGKLTEISAATSGVIAQPKAKDSSTVTSPPTTNVQVVAGNAFAQPIVKAISTDIKNSDDFKFLSNLDISASPPIQQTQRIAKPEIKEFIITDMQSLENTLESLPSTPTKLGGGGGGSKIITQLDTVDDGTRVESDPPDLIPGTSGFTTIHLHDFMSNGKLVNNSNKIGGCGGKFLDSGDEPGSFDKDDLFRPLRLADFSVTIDPKNGMSGLLFSLAHRLVLTSNSALKTLSSLNKSIMTNEVVTLCTLGFSSALFNLQESIFGFLGSAISNSTVKMIDLLNNASNASDIVSRAEFYLDNVFAYTFIVSQKAVFYCNGEIYQRDPNNALIPMVTGDLMICCYNVTKIGSFMSNRQDRVIAAPAIIRWVCAQFMKRDSFKANAAFAIKSKLNYFSIPAWIVDQLMFGTMVIADLWNLKLNNKINNLTPHLNF